MRALQKKVHVWLAAFVVLPLLSIRPAWPAAERPVVLELFTSQGCSSCPPADALLGILAKRDGVLALSFHIDYWDRLGWKDPYSLPLATARQRYYATLLGSQVYTPQLVVDGVSETVGADRYKIEALLTAGRSAKPSVPVDISRVGGNVHLDIGALAAAQAAIQPAAAARIMLISFDSQRGTDVGAGENSGRHLSSVNVVRSLRVLGSWRGEASSRDEPLQPQETGSRFALLIQAADGTIWAAASTQAADF